MNFEEFLQPKETPATPTTDATNPNESESSNTNEVESSVELDVQKAVVESLAADKAEQDERISNLQKENNRLMSENAALNEKLATMKTELEKVAEALVRNIEPTLANKLTLLEREVEIEDRFPGETRDHVLEVIKEARDEAEQNGRLRRAQVLESVLVANEPSGELTKRREELNKLFVDNANIINGPVIDELVKLGISHKNGENYLLPSEIFARNY